METGKTCWGIEQREEKERQRQRERERSGRKRDNNGGERKWHGLEGEDGVS
jgi:hypothetical protein